MTVYRQTGKNMQRIYKLGDETSDDGTTTEDDNADDSDDNESPPEEDDYEGCQ